MKRERVLIADDTPSHRSILSKVFTKGGYDVILANNGNQALQLIRQHKPDVVVLDAVMPGLVGYEISSLIRQDPGLKNTVIIITSAVDRSDDPEFAAEFDADYFIEKEKLCMMSGLRGLPETRRLHGDRQIALQ